MIGPFVFVDQMGPGEFAPGTGLDVRPHPHIGIATVTYVFDGSILHRDSLGTTQLIKPGELNWMTAGSGIVHSERTPADMRPKGSEIDGLQCWVALPRAAEETQPDFSHFSHDRIPKVEEKGVIVHVLVGKIFGKESPVSTYSDTLYLDTWIKANHSLAIPTKGREVGIMPVKGTVAVAGHEVPTSSLVVARSGDPVVIRAATDARVMVIGGEPLGEPREMWWNFVSSSKERIEQAKADWQAGRFPKVPGDDIEFTPLPSS